MGKMTRTLSGGLSGVLVTAGIVVVGGVILIGSLSRLGAANVSAIPAACTSDATVAALTAYGGGTPISGSHTTIGAAAAWQEADAQVDGVTFVSQLRDMPATALVDVCEYTGSFYAPMAPPQPGQTPRPLPNVMKVFVFGDGNVVMESAGYKGVMSLDLPGASAAPN